jgi:hypothetical protein
VTRWCRYRVSGVILAGYRQAIVFV